MVLISNEFATLSPSNVTLYQTTDPQLANLPLLIFHGASTTANSTLNSSRIQVHVFTAAGFQSYPRLTISPNSPFYTVVDHLPRDRQGDEVCRGLAFGLFKYFKDLPENVKAALIVQSSKSSRSRRPGSAPTMFGEQHAANLASTMIKVDNFAEVHSELRAGMDSQSVSNIDVDLVLPPGTISSQKDFDDDNLEDDDGNYDASVQQYGSYASLVKLFGQTAFLPTSKLRRAPSKASALNRTRSFLREQKQSLRREMAELVDTEERYVIKLHDLAGHVADDFRQKAKKREFGSFSPSEEDLKKLFPPSLDRILAVNSSFLKAIQKVMNDTEEDAMLDLEADQAGSASSRYGGSGRLKDPTGAVAFAKVLLEWFPQFSDAYQDYIRASQDFPRIITGFVKQQSSFSSRLQDFGEQRLRSAVIEPVQRLPRYSLFIDNIVNYLPISHPALQPMLKARDVITEICSLDPPSTDKSQTVNRLRNLVDFWPSSLFPQGRLITAVDVLEREPPYQTIEDSAMADSGILLLFSDSVVVLSKSRDCSLSARGIMAEVDKPSAATMMATFTAGASGQRPTRELSLAGWHSLCDVRFTESTDGRVTWMVSTQESKDAAMEKDRHSSAPTLHSYVLRGSYDGKASRWIEEVAKARIEGRFAESERESEKWSLRNINLKTENLNVWTAVFEEGIDSLVQGRKEPAPIRIVVDHEKGTKGAPVGHYGIEIVANVKMSQDFSKGGCGLVIDGLNDRVFTDSVDETTFMPVFVKRIGDLMRAQFIVGNPALTLTFISYYSKILRSLHLQIEVDKSKSFRPPSPVKILSSFLSSTGSFGSSTSRQSRTPVLGSSVPHMRPPLSRNNSHSIVENGKDFRSSSRSVNEDGQPNNPLVRLEETFTGYVAALQSRKGNIVGKALRNRGNADELNVNALYNTFIENPFDTRTASDVTLDVLFASFEKFLRMAWKDQMGPVVTLQALQSLQEKALELYPGDFAEFIQSIFVNMAPQNRRAFVAIVKLLADLLEGCGNDGDRGALTVAFAELLVTEGDPANFVNLLDRLVQDCDRLFEDLGPGANVGYVTPQFGSVSSTAYSTRSGNGGSMTSNTSLRKRFGLETLLRQNSKSESGSGNSMWRTLSKSGRSIVNGDLSSSSLSKASLHRSRSIESEQLFETPNKSRPVSRDRPTVLGVFDDRPSSSHNRMTTIEASPPPEDPLATKSLKKKRRSSLSDLKSLMASATLNSPSSPLSPRPSRLPTFQPTKFNSSPRTPSPTKTVIGSNLERPTPPPLEASPMIRNVGALTERPQNIMSEEVETKDTASANTSPDKVHKSTTSLSNIPVLKGTSRVATATSSPTRPILSPQKSSPQKYRLQSPQKLRERLQNGVKAISAAEATLQNELSKIGEEMAKVNISRSVNLKDGTTTVNSDVQRLSESMRALESKVSGMVEEWTSNTTAIKKDLETSLQASEFKIKGLDQLYKEASAENELLYEKFNGELGKIVKALKGKGREDREELVVKTKEASEETAKVKKENARLRRELLTLKTLLRGRE